MGKGKGEIIRAAAGDGGLYRKSVPRRLAEKYLAAVEGEDLISVRHEAALVQALIAEVLEGLDLDHCESLWEELSGLVRKMPEVGEADEWIERVSTAIRSGADEWRKVQKLLGYFEQKRKLAWTEAKRLKDLESSLNAKQANALIGAILASINKHVTDHDARVRVATDLAGLLRSAA